jgi:PAS domain S-box-containing protein
MYYSSLWKEQLGYKDYELPNSFETWERLIHKDDKNRAFKTLKNFIESKEDKYELEHRLRCKDGSYRTILSRGVALRDRDSKPYRLAGSNIDITDLRNKEKIIKKYELDNTVKT